MGQQVSFNMIDGLTDVSSGDIYSEAVDVSTYKNILFQSFAVNVGDLIVQGTSVEDPDGTPDAVSWVDIGTIGISSASLWSASSIIPICTKWLRVRYLENPVVGGGLVRVYMTEQG